MNVATLIARKEAGDLLLSARGLAWLLAAAAVLSVFALLLVSNTELSLLDNAQVVYEMAAIVTALGAMLGTVTGVETIAGERERGTLVPLLVSPASRGGILLGKAGGIAIAWTVLYVLGLPYFWAIGSTGQNLANGAIITALLGTPVVLGFGFFAMALGARLGSSRSALTTALVVLLLSASPLLIGPGLRQSAIGRAFDAVNPFSAAANAYDAVIIDSMPISAQMARATVVLAWLLFTAWFAQRGFLRVAH